MIWAVVLISIAGGVISGLVTWLFAWLVTRRKP